MSSSSCLRLLPSLSLLPFFPQCRVLQVSSCVINSYRNKADKFITKYVNLLQIHVSSHAISFILNGEASAHDHEMLVLM